LPPWRFVAPLLDLDCPSPLRLSDQTLAGRWFVIFIFERRIAVWK
jgi:hypothetical protein